MYDKSLDTKKNVGEAAGKPPDHRDSRKILLVDDEKCILMTLSWIFENIGFETTIAGNGFDALNNFLGKPFDIVITDLNMKGMDGLELIRKIKQKSPDTPAILLTGEDSVSVKKRIKGNKADLILFKPFKIKEIENAALRVMTGKRDSADNIVFQ